MREPRLHIIFLARKRKLSLSFDMAIEEVKAESESASVRLSQRRRMA